MKHGHPDAVFYPYSLFKKFMAACGRVREDENNDLRKMIAYSVRAGNCEDQKTFEKYIGE